MEVNEEKRRATLIKINNKTRSLLQLPLITDFSSISNDEIFKDNILLSFEILDDDEMDEDI
ncbi:hypothetical protein ACMGD3_24345 [Lysinibacillus sphaericus]|uniref:hypothetical protein n=1 Tax=Lysinibacillus sphaericus TaxID=1421 RepID=UPI003F7A15AC